MVITMAHFCGELQREVDDQASHLEGKPQLILQGNGGNVTAAKLKQNQGWVKKTISDDKEGAAWIKPPKRIQFHKASTEAEGRMGLEWFSVLFRPFPQFSPPIGCLFNIWHSQHLKRKMEAEESIHRCSVNCLNYIPVKIFVSILKREYCFHLRAMECWASEPHQVRQVTAAWSVDHLLNFDLPNAYLQVIYWKLSYLFHQTKALKFHMIDKCFKIHRSLTFEHSSSTTEACM